MKNQDSGLEKNQELTFSEIYKNIQIFSNELRKHYLLLLIILIIGSVSGLAFSYYEKPKYKAVLTFAMEDDKGSSSSGINGALGLASSFGIDLGNSGGGGAFAASNIAELIKSRLIFEKVILKPITINKKKITLADYYIQTSGLKKDWINDDKLSNLNFPLNIERNKFSILQDSILKIIHRELIDDKNLSISQKDKKISILYIEVKSVDELFSKFFCENLAIETSNFYIDTKTKKAKYNVDVLQKQVDSVKFELYGAISGVASEVDNVYNLNPALNKRGTGSKKKQIDVQANTSVLTNLIVQLELAKITLRKETPLIQLIDAPIFPLEKFEFGKIKSMLIGSIILLLITIISIILLFIHKNKIVNKNYHE